MEELRYSGRRRRRCGTKNCEACEFGHIHRDDLRELVGRRQGYQQKISDCCAGRRGGYTYTDATYTEEEYAAVLQARGLEKLAECLQTLEVDATIGQGLMQYGRDYTLGDIIPLKLTR